MAADTVSADGGESEFYVYILYRPDGRPCYVGKGKRYRWKHHFYAATNRHLKSILAKYGDGIVVQRVEDLSDDEAYELEELLIFDIGRQCDGGPLANISTGGVAAASGTIADADRRKKQSDARQTWWAENRPEASANAKIRYQNDPAYRQQMCRAVEAARSAASVAKRVVKLTGRKVSQVTRDKLSESAKARATVDRSNGTTRLNGNSLKTHCVRGHGLTGDNLYIHPATGMRACKTCKRVRKHRYRLRLTPT